MTQDQLQAEVLKELQNKGLTNPPSRPSTGRSSKKAKSAQKVGRATNRTAKAPQPSQTERFDQMTPVSKQAPEPVGGAMHDRSQQLLTSTKVGSTLGISPKRQAIYAKSSMVKTKKSNLLADSDVQLAAYP
jgi:hypothetical protein